jgi:hypothetical protein
VFKALKSLKVAPSTEFAGDGKTVGIIKIAAKELIAAGIAVRTLTDFILCMGRSTP